MIDPKIRAQVRRLIARALSYPEINRKTGVSKRTIIRIAKENGIQGSRPGRPSKTAPFIPLIRSVLKRRPDASSTGIFERAVEAGYDGSRAAFYQRVRAVRTELATERGKDSRARARKQRPRTGTSVQ